MVTAISLADCQMLPYTEHLGLCPRTSLHLVRADKCPSRVRLLDLQLLLRQLGRRCRLRVARVGSGFRSQTVDTSWRLSTIRFTATSGAPER